MSRRAALAALALALAAPAARAQTVVTGSEWIPFDRPESWALARSATATLFTGFGPPEAVELGQLRVGVEAGNIPGLNLEERTVGFNGTKPEELNKVPLLVRPRLAVGLPAKLTLEAGYIPPIRLWGQKANLLAAALGRPVVEAGPFRLGLRGYGQLGSVHGAFTCGEDAVAAGADKAANPFGCLEPSDDEALLRYVGLELGAAYRIEPLHDLEVHLAGAANYMDLAFHVNARYGDVVDTTQLHTHGFTGAGTAGLALPITPRFRLAGDAFYSPLWVQRPGQDRHSEGLFNARGLLEYRFF